MSAVVTHSRATAGEQRYTWYRELSGYHWFVLGVTSLGWLFDCMAQQLFSLARKPAITELLGGHASDSAVSEQAGYATMVFMIGWGLGGLIFGVLGDRWGRAKTMFTTILSYTVFTAASMAAVNVWQFHAFRFLCGLGVGGQFAVGVALVAEVIAPRARPFALGVVQASAMLGNMLAALTGILLGHLEQSGAIAGAWRYLFLAGAAPAPLALVVFKKLKEPDQWLKARAQKLRMGSFGDLFREKRWRRNAIVGLLLAFSGVVGLWGIGYFSYDLLRPVLERTFASEGFAGSELAGKITTWVGITSLLQNIGGFVGVWAFTYFTHFVGRKPAFAFSFVMAAGVTAFVFARLTELSEIFWMIPLMGFSQMTLFGGYSIYLPELFPTRLRSTGTSFCYNVGRFAAALGPLGMGLLTSRVFHGPNAMRYAGVAMCSSFVVGLVALPFAPETKDHPLPD